MIEPDCPDLENDMCSLKFVGRCYNQLFNKVYSNICKWREALELMPQINQWLVALGVKWEKMTGNKCDGNSNDRFIEADPEFDYDLDGMYFSILIQIIDPATIFVFFQNHI